MNKLIMASLISTIFSFLSFNSEGQIKVFLQYRDCDEAKEKAILETQNDTIKYYLSVSDYAPIDHPRFLVLDSVLSKRFPLEIIRTHSVRYDYTLQCYNKFIRAHLDSLVGKENILEAYLDADSIYNHRR